MKLIIKVFAMILSIVNFVNSQEPALRWNKPEEHIRHFRTFADISTNRHLSQTGIEGLYMSGSGQFTGTSITQLKGKVQEVADQIQKIIIIDTRLESHGFINHFPIAWKVPNDANIEKTVEEIIIDEKNRLLEIFQNKMVYNSRASENIEVNEVMTEEELVIAHGFEYVRLPILDHSYPCDVVVDEFLELIKNNPNAWLHVHCHVGKGRTTTFMIIYDMFYNAKDLEFQEILKRHKEIGGYDFIKHLDNIEERLIFLAKFYRYCKESDPQNITWQTWLQQH